MTKTEQRKITNFSRRAEMKKQRLEDRKNKRLFKKKI